MWVLNFDPTGQRPGTGTVEKLMCKPGQGVGGGSEIKRTSKQRRVGRVRMPRLKLLALSERHPVARLLV